MENYQLKITKTEPTEEPELLPYQEVMIRFGEKSVVLTRPKPPKISLNTNIDIHESFAIGRVIIKRIG